MNAAAPSTSRLLATFLPPLALVVCAPAFLGTGGVFHSWSSLDVHYMRLPLVLAGVLWLGNRLAAWVGSTVLSTRFVWSIQAADRQLRIDLLPVVRSFFADSAWTALVWGLLASVRRLPDTISGHPSGPDLTSATPYLAAFDSLALWAVLVLVTLAMARGFSSIFPDVRSAIGLPVGGLVVLAVAHVFLSEEGVLYAEFGTDLSGIAVVLGVVVALVYAASVLDRASSSGLLERIAPEVAGAVPFVRASVAVVVPSILVWVGLDNLPVIGELLSNRAVTRWFAETYATHFAGMTEARNAATLLALITGLALTLPRALGASLERYHGLLTALLFSAGACIAWTIGASLSHVSQFYALAGAISASGLFTLAVTQLAGYATTSSNLTLAELGAWLSESRVRGFVLGAAVSYYALLLHPFLHEVMRFAALFEYMAVLALVMLLLLRFRKAVRVETERPYRMPLTWPDWSHHRQRLAERRDPRAVGMRDLEERFALGADWRPMLTYLLLLLYRSEAPIEYAEEVCRSMRRSLLASVRPYLPGAFGRRMSMRRTALMESLATVEEGLALPGRLRVRADEEFLRQAAADYIQDGTNPERLTAAMILAFSQKGSDLSAAINYWILLLSGRASSPGWYVPSWLRSRSMTRSREHRARVVDDAVAYLFGSQRRPAEAPWRDAAAATT